MITLYPKKGFSLAYKLIYTASIAIVSAAAVKYNVVQGMWHEGLVGKAALTCGAIAYAYVLAVLWLPAKYGKMLMKV